MRDKKGVIKIEYIITMPDKNERLFSFELDEKTLKRINKPESSYPEWTELEFEKCANCKKDKSKHKYCPAALGIYEVVKVFKDEISYKEVSVKVITKEREYNQKVDMQRLVSSLLGICMATSGCRYMEKLKHMVRFHLPMATPFETLNRVLSSYLLAQYFRQKKGLKSDWQLKHLKDIYENVRQVNVAMKDRLLATGKGDANLNAIVRLDVFAVATADFLEGGLMHDLESIFEPYFD